MALRSPGKLSSCGRISKWLLITQPTVTCAESSFPRYRGVNDFLLELVPLTMRGKELGRMLAATGSVHSESIVRYENVTIAETLNNGKRARMTVMFNEECGDSSRH
jgi:hypothetical protein